MSTLTEFLAAVVVHFAAIAFSHFGVMVDPVITDRPAPAERVVARTPQQRAERVDDCPHRAGQHAQLLKT